MVYVIQTAVEQQQDHDGTAVPSWSCCSKAVYKPVWHTPLLSVQWITPDDGQRDCLKHVEFHFQNKCEKLVHLVDFIIRKFVTMHGHMNVKKNGGTVPSLSGSDSEKSGKPRRPWCRSCGSKWTPNRVQVLQLPTISAFAILFFVGVCKLLLCLSYEQCYHHHAFTPALVCGDNNQLSPVLFPVSTLHSSSSCLPCFVTWQAISWIRFVGSRKSTTRAACKQAPPPFLSIVSLSLWGQFQSCNS
jgi:hypothetical protein